MKYKITISIKVATGTLTNLVLQYPVVLGATSKKTGSFGWYIPLGKAGVKKNYHLFLLLFDPEVFKT